MVEKKDWICYLNRRQCKTTILLDGDPEVLISHRYVKWMGELFWPGQLPSCGRLGSLKSLHFWLNGEEETHEYLTNCLNIVEKSWLAFLSTSYQVTFWNWRGNRYVGMKGKPNNRYKSQSWQLPIHAGNTWGAGSSVFCRLAEKLYELR